MTHEEILSRLEQSSKMARETIAELEYAMTQLPKMFMPKNSHKCFDVDDLKQFLIEKSNKLDPLKTYPERLGFHRAIIFILDKIREMEANDADTKTS